MGGNLNPSQKFETGSENALYNVSRLRVNVFDKCEETHWGTLGAAHTVGTGIGPRPQPLRHEPPMLPRPVGEQRTGTLSNNLRSENFQSDVKCFGYLQAQPKKLLLTFDFKT